MKKKYIIIFLIILLSLVYPLVCFAAENINVTKRSWKLSAGLKVRAAKDVSFKGTSLAAEQQWQGPQCNSCKDGYFGKWGLYENKREYSDGEVSFDYLWNCSEDWGISGDFYIEINSQIDYEFLFSEFWKEWIGNGYIFSGISFHSYKWDYFSETSTFITDGKESFTASIGPYISLSKKIWDSKQKKCSIDIAFDWSFHCYNVAQSPVLAYEYRYYEKITTLTDTYAADTAYIDLDVIGWPDAPIEVIDAYIQNTNPQTYSFIVWEPELASEIISPGFFDEFDKDELLIRNVTNDINETYALQSYIEDELDIKLNVVSLGSSILWSPNKVFSCYIGGAFTLNVIDWNLERIETFYQVRPDILILDQIKNSTSGTKTMIGGRINAGILLNPKGSWSISVDIGYEYLDKFTLETETSKAEINLSGITGSISIGKKF
ncbi:MAG: hypothetical protein P9M03_11275 [Candidatus Theseobacter exili]|nr:hypothetical protein [Candidatus Theseobacter exili]